MPSGMDLNINVQETQGTPLDIDIGSSGTHSLAMNVQQTQGTPLTIQAAGSGTHDIEMTVQMGGEGSASNAEAWAVGERHGVPVASTDPTYHNNSKYYCEQAEQTVLGQIIDDTAGAGVTNRVWSANKTYTEMAAKAPVASPAFTESISMGRESGTTVGSGSVAVGVNTRATASAAFAEGSGTQAVEEAAHSEGYQTQAKKEYCHAEGESTVSDGRAAHSEGIGTLADGRASHSEGNNTSALGYCAHAEGNGTSAVGDFSHVSGLFNVPDTVRTWAANTRYYVGDRVNTPGGSYQYARCIAEHTSGSTFDASKWTSVVGEGSNYAEIVGNGMSGTTSNARVLEWNGTERLKGDLYVRCNANSTGGKKVAAEELVLNGSYEYIPDYSADFTYGYWYHEVGYAYVHTLTDKYKGAHGIPGAMGIMGDDIYHLPTTSDEDWNVYTFLSLINSKMSAADVATTAETQAIISEYA